MWSSSLVPGFSPLPVMRQTNKRKVLRRGGEELAEAGAQTRRENQPGCQPPALLVMRGQGGGAPLNTAADGWLLTAGPLCSLQAGPALICLPASQAAPQGSWAGPSELNLEKRQGQKGCTQPLCSFACCHRQSRVGLGSHLRVLVQCGTFMLPAQQTHHTYSA